MNRSVFSIILLALIGHLCVAEIVVRTSKPKHFIDLYDAAIDVLMACHGDPGSAVGLVGDSDGSVLDALRSKYFVPVVLLNSKADYVVDYAKQHPLRSFVIAADTWTENLRSIRAVVNGVWWNQHANYIFIDPEPNHDDQCLVAIDFIVVHLYLGLLNAQSICNNRTSGIWIYNSNQFTAQAPPVWKLARQEKMGTAKAPITISVFNRRYRKGGQACEALNFPKTIDIDGWPVRFFAVKKFDLYDIDDPKIQRYLKKISHHERIIFESNYHRKRWFVDNMARALNATAVIVQRHRMDEFYEGSIIYGMGITLWPFYLSSMTSVSQKIVRNTIVRRSEVPMFAVTKHTGHKSQLEKILTVIDSNSRIGMCLVYLITFLFFIFVLRQAAMSALLNLIRLTCNMALPRLPNNLGPTIYLACLLMFVVTLQAIFTGNLATLLTTTVAHRNVQTKRDIPSLGYTVYTQEDTNAKLAADPILAGRVVEIPFSEGCINYVLTKSLATCVEEQMNCLAYAVKWKLHISRYPIVHEYPIYYFTVHNPLGPRLGSIMTRWVEHGLWREDPVAEKLRLLYVDDEEVMKNTERRVMNLEDLCFSFVILGVGLLCSFICFIGEIVVCKVRLIMAKRRNRVRTRLAWGVKENSFLSFRSFNFRFNPRRLFFRHVVRPRVSTTTT